MRTQLVTITALIAFAGVGGVAGAMIGQHNTAAPPAHTTEGAGAADQAPTTPGTPLVVTTPTTVPVATATRTVVVHKSTPKERPVTEQPTGWAVPEDDDTSEATVTQPAPTHPVQAVEPDPTPEPAPAMYADQSDGITSMNGVPDPMVGTVAPGPIPTPVPPSK